MTLAGILVLELLSLIVLFKGVLGYDFRDNRLWVAAGIAMFSVQWVLETIFHNEGTSLMLVEFYVPALSAVIMFKGEKWNIFLIGIGMYALFIELNSACVGVAILKSGGKNLIDINLPLVMIVALILMFGIFVILGIVFRTKKKDINRNIEKLSPSVLLSFVIVYPIFYYSQWSSGSIEYLAEITNGKNQIRNGIVFCVFLVVAVLSCILISQRGELQRMLHLNEKCIQEQTEQYRLLSSRDRELRKFRHDYNGHIIALQNLAESGSREELVRYIEGLSMARSRFKLICSNNIICDAILNQYVSLCREAEIELKVKGNLPDDLLIPETDLCVIVSNAVKNAYEAVKQCSDKRKIQIEFSNTGNFASIQIINPAKELPLIRDGVFQTTKTDRLNHGIGMENMLEAAGKHGGKITWTCEDGIVITDILLRCKEK